MYQRRFSLLSRLWLKEADTVTLAEMEAFPDLNKQVTSLNELAVAYTDTFLLNVYPYASVFLDMNAEMNGLRSRELSALYSQSGYQPDSISEAGAPDHIGLVLGLLAQIPGSLHASVLSKYVLDWAPVLCFSVERQPGIHPFYRALASCTRRELFSAWKGEDISAQGPALSHHSLPVSGKLEDDWSELPQSGLVDELTLSQIIHYLICPARCGIFLSRTRMGQWARGLGVPLAFGERYRLGISLFEAAGMVDQAPQLIEWLQLELGAWDAAYLAWCEEYPVWKLFAGEWRERIATAHNFLEKARFSLQASLP